MSRQIKFERVGCMLLLTAVALAATPNFAFAQGACCVIVDGVGICQEPLSPIGCINQPGGLYLGDGTTCEEDGFRCELGACCTLEGCVILRQSECFNQGGFGYEVGADCSSNPCGACCSPLGDCTDSSVSDCGNQDGAEFFAGVYCDTSPCGPRPTGACCNGSACTDDVTPQDCAAGGGQWAGTDSTCADEPVPCELGACCVDTDCFDVSRAECTNVGGTFNVGVCTPQICAPPTGACCAGTVCIVTQANNCTEAQGRIYQGDGTVCTPDLCGDPMDPTGACCTESGCIDDLTAEDCAGNSGIYLGDNSACEEGICDFGACCRGSVCTIDIQLFCTQVGGEFQGPNTVCDEETCGAAPTGACCRSDGTCEDGVESANCVEPDVFLGNGTNCTPDACNTSACCTSAGCFDLSESECISANGLFLQGSTCSENPCDAGACCSDDICVFAPAYSCFSGGRTFIGAGIPCMPDNPCVGCATCLGDVNGDTIRDGLDMAMMIECILNPDPMQCKCADMNDDGASTLADVGQFVNSMLNDTGPC